MEPELKVVRWGPITWYDWLGNWVPIAVLRCNLIVRIARHQFKVFDVFIRGQLGKDDEMGKDVMHRIWEVLQETHRIRSLR